MNRNGIRRWGLAAALALLLTAFATTNATASGPVDVKIRLASDEVDAGDSLLLAATVRNGGTTPCFVLVEGHAETVEEKIRVPKISRWEKFVYEVLALIASDYDVLYVPAGQTRTAVLELDIHPRMHGRFEAVVNATTIGGNASARESFVSVITAPPSNGAVLIHGRLIELGDCRIIITDDGHVYEPVGRRADYMMDVLGRICPAPDGVTVLGRIQENTVGCFGVEIELDFFRFDREPGTPLGLEFANVSIGRTLQLRYPRSTEVIRDPNRLRRIMSYFGARLQGDRPNFRREHVALVTEIGSNLSRLRVRRIVEKNGVTEIHYVMSKPASDCTIPQRRVRLYHFVRFPRGHGPFKFVKHTVEARCDAPRTGTLDVPVALKLSSDRLPALKAEAADKIRDAAADRARALRTATSK